MNLFWKRLAMAGSIVWISVAVLIAEPPRSSKPSSYAPAKDLRAQVDYFLGRMEKDLQDQSQYGKDQQERIERDASTLAAIALVMGMHDQQNDLKRAASNLIEASNALAGSAEDYQQAKEALAKVKQTLAAAEQSEPVNWEPAADLVQLMKQVPIVNNSLRRGVLGRRFKRSAGRNAGYAATLAAIAQASLADTDYCSDEEEEAEWRKACILMRDAAGAVNDAVHQRDQAAAKTALAQLAKSCDVCHHTFREEN